MSKVKQAWQRPELVVLVRTRPEEAVLSGCKGPGFAGQGRPVGQACIHPSQGQCALLSTS